MHSSSLHDGEQTRGDAQGLLTFNRHVGSRITHLWGLPALLVCARCVEDRGMKNIDLDLCRRGYGANDRSAHRSQS